MPVKIPASLPARATLESENVFVMGEERAAHQDIRPMRVAILNLMPTKVATETQILRLIGNSALQVDVTLLRTTTHEPRNASADHLVKHYCALEEIRGEKFDGLIITGAPIEHMEFEAVDYWSELTRILDWAATDVVATLNICWGAQAALYHYYGVPKYPLPRKLFGVFEHRTVAPTERLLRGFDDRFFAPHSRHTEFRRADVEKIPDLRILAESDVAGVYLVSSRDGRRVFVTGHSEYDPLTLKAEHDRDLAKGLKTKVPENYYPYDDPSQPPQVRWRSHASLLYANWLNYYVYQVTPFDLGSYPKGTVHTDF
jgi:homoserine O-succinyltransferase/O-acetyltransferase